VQLARVGDEGTEDRSPLLVVGDRREEEREGDLRVGIVRGECAVRDRADPATETDVLDARGLSEHRLKACGYSLGTTFSPNWMDWPMLYERNPVVIEPGMVIFMHMIIADSDAELAMTLGETVLVTDDGNERLSAASLDMIAK